MNTEKKNLKHNVSIESPIAHENFNTYKKVKFISGILSYFSTQKINQCLLLH